MNYKYYKEIVCKTYIPQAGMDCDCEACKQTKKEIEECKFDIENNCELEYDE